MMNLKVGVMPGKLQEVVVEEGTTVKEIFEVAEITTDNMECRLDGKVVELNEQVNNGNLLVAMKRIKGNMPVIKVGIMPGKLQEVIVEDNTPAKEVFNLAGMEVNNMEYRLDGRVINEDEPANGNLLVAMKRIKGNKEMYTTDYPYEEIEFILGVGLPKEIDKKDVQYADNMVIINETNIVDVENFESIYTLHTVEEKEEIIHNQDLTTPVGELKETPCKTEGTCKCKNKIGEVQKIYDNCLKRKEYLMNDLISINDRLEVLETVLNIIK